MEKRKERKQMNSGSLQKKTETNKRSVGKTAFGRQIFQVCLGRTQRWERVCGTPTIAARLQKKKKKKNIHTSSISLPPKYPELYCSIPIPNSIPQHWRVSDHFNFSMYIIIFSSSHLLIPRSRGVCELKNWA